LPSSPALAGAEVELVSELGRETRLKNALASLQDSYDYILLDCPPSLGLLTINGLMAAQDGVITEVNNHFPKQVFKAVIPRSIRLAEAPSYGLPISAYAPSSVGAKAYDALAQELLAGDGKS